MTCSWSTNCSTSAWSYPRHSWFGRAWWWWQGANRLLSLSSGIPKLLRQSVTTNQLIGRSGSMEPAFHRGDLLFLTNHKEDPIGVGDIVVFKVEGRDIPIVHRVLKLHQKYGILCRRHLCWTYCREDGSIKILTKGDNNSVDDRGLYAPGQLWLHKKDIVGRARG